MRKFEYFIENDIVFIRKIRTFFSIPILSSDEFEATTLWERRTSSSIDLFIIENPYIYSGNTKPEIGDYRYEKVKFIKTNKPK